MSTFIIFVIGAHIICYKLALATINEKLTSHTSAHQVSFKTYISDLFEDNKKHNSITCELLFVICYPSNATDTFKQGMVCRNDLSFNRKVFLQVRFKCPKLNSA